jgi:thymidine kinase
MDSGHLHIIIGPMFSGKTSHLIDTYKSTHINQEKAIVINHCSDNRYSTKEEVISHDGTSIPCQKIESLRELYSQFHNKELNYKDYRFLFINEAQFFDDLHLVIIFLEKYKFNIYLYGLDGDFQRKPFKNNILDYIPYSDNVIKLNAKCSCGQNAPFTMRLNDDKEQISVGVDNYRAVCRTCYNSYKK